MSRTRKTDEQKPFWKTGSKKRGEKRFPFGFFEENRPKHMAILGPGGGFGIGCGLGIGVGIVGGVGYGGGPWNHLRLAFGVGMGCGVGFGFGYGNGIGIGLGLGADDFEVLFLDKKKPDSKGFVIEV